jgi:hypothetical protein
MTKDKINDEPVNLQEAYKNILQRTANIEVYIAKLRDDMRQLMKGLPFDEANKIANLNISLDMIRQELHNNLTDFEKELENKIIKPEDK